MKQTKKSPLKGQMMMEVMMMELFLKLKVCNFAFKLSRKALMNIFSTRFTMLSL